MDFSTGVDVLAKVKSGGIITGEYEKFLYIQNGINSQLLIYNQSGGISGMEATETDPQEGNIYFHLQGFKKSGDRHIKITGITRKPNHCEFRPSGEEVEVKLKFDDTETRDKFFKELQTKQSGGGRNKKSKRKSKLRKSKRRSRKSKRRRKKSKKRSRRSR